MNDKPKKFDMSRLQPRSQRDNREDVERETQSALVPDSRARLRKGKVKSILFRCTEDRYMRIVKLADVLSVGCNSRISITDTIEAALDALEARHRLDNK